MFTIYQPDILNNGAILKLHYDVDTKTLYLLKDRFDGTLYVESFKSDEESKCLAELQNILCITFSDEYLQPEQMGYNENVKFVFSDIIHFEINTKHSLILLQASSFWLPEELSGVSKNDNPNRYLIFGFDGKLIETRVLDIGDDQFYYNHEWIHAISFFDSNSLINTVRGYDGRVQMWKLFSPNETTLYCSNNKNFNDEGSYYYIESVAIHRTFRLIAVLVAQTDVGVDAIKILSIDDVGNTTLIFNFLHCDDWSDWAFHHLAFHPLGRKFSSLAYSGGAKESFQIRIFDLNNNAGPDKIVAVKGIIYNEIIEVQYLDQERLCFILKNGFSIFDLNLAIVIKTIRKEESTPFCFADDSIFYINDGWVWRYTFKQNNDERTIIRYKHF